MSWFNDDEAKIKGLREQLEARNQTVLTLEARLKVTKDALRRTGARYRTVAIDAAVKETVEWIRGLPVCSSVRSCPACGGKPNSVTRCYDVLTPPTREVWHRDTYLDAGGEHEEEEIEIGDKLACLHLHRTCSECRHSWNERPRSSIKKARKR